MFTFLLHDLYMPWSWPLGITAPPFMNCSVSQRVELHNTFTVNIIATLLLVGFIGKIMESLSRGFLDNPYSRYQLIHFFLRLWGNRSLVGYFSKKTDLGSPLQLSAPCQAALPSPSMQCPPISHVKKLLPELQHEQDHGNDLNEKYHLKCAAKKAVGIVFKSTLFINQVQSLAQQAILPGLLIRATAGCISAYNTREGFELLWEKPRQI